MFSLSSQLGGGGVEIGECLYFPKSAANTLLLEGMTFLKTGLLIVDEAANYPEAFATFSRGDLGGTTPIDLKIGNVINDMAYNGTRYVAVGETGKFSYSTDGVNWTLGSSPAFGTTRITHVTFGAGLFVALYGLANVATSSDGITWTARNSTIGDSYPGSALTFNPGQNGFYASNTNGVVSISSNGISWSLVGGVTGGSSIVGFSNHSSWVQAYSAAGVIYYTLTLGNNFTNGGPLPNSATLNPKSVTTGKLAGVTTSVVVTNAGIVYSTAVGTAVQKGTIPNCTAILSVAYVTGDYPGGGLWAIACLINGVAAVYVSADLVIWRQASLPFNGYVLAANDIMITWATTQATLKLVSKKLIGAPTPVLDGQYLMYVRVK